MQKVENQKTSHKIGHLGTILLVEDNEADIELARIMLIDEPNMKCNMKVARDADEAMKILNSRKSKIDLILLDINMPGVDGFDLLNKLRSDETLKKIPVVVCTTSTYSKDIAKAKTYGAIGYLPKPPELGKLKPLIKETNIKLEPNDDGYNLICCG